ncbi:MAG: CehA/McbA family metallohydrolase [Chloroflexi bacterium]|nr:CehA/McbA family metallohydrolase [Chloroflexota bacterium]
MTNASEQFAPTNLSVTVTPDRGQIGEWGTWTVRFTVGEDGIRQGGAIQVALPISWHQWWRNSSRRVQATAPADPFYVSARASRPGVRLRCEVQEETPPGGATEDEFVKRSRIDIDGRPSRYAWVVRVTVEEGALTAGDTIDVRYGDRSGGSRGFTPPLWGESPDRVRAAVDADGSGHFVLLPEDALPWLYVDPGEPAELAIVVPSTTVAGEPAEALVVALDANLNPTWAPGLRVGVRVAEGEAELAAEGRPAPIATVMLDRAEQRSVRLRFVPRAEGIIRLRAQSVDGRLYAHSNPSRCAAAAPAERLYWGDIHGHTSYSGDGTGAPEDAYRYARDVSGLEIYGNADHDGALSEQDWREIVERNARYYEPGRFVTLVGYEMGYRYPYGHHNAYFRGADGPLIKGREMPLPEYWAQATPGEVLTIPHHTVALGRPGRPNVDWSVHDDRFRPLVEIYSGHGQSEVSAPDHPLASDVVDFTLTGPADSPSSVQEGWLTGLRLGVIASSDNHCARPGREGFGTMAVYAPELTREAVFDAMRRRRTYATTGSRIILDFAVNGTPMGGECRIEPGQAGQAAHLTGHVTGPGPLRFVEILRADLSAPAEEREWQIAHRHWFSGMGAPCELTLDWTDEQPPPHGVYYIRVRQRDAIHGRVAMAWSSPVWVERG